MFIAKKPLAVNSTQAFLLAQLAEHRQRVLMVGFNRRYASVPKSPGTDGGRKKIQLVIIQKHRPSLITPPCMMLYWNDGIHQIDLMRF